MSPVDYLSIKEGGIFEIRIPVESSQLHLHGVLNLNKEVRFHNLSIFSEPVVQIG